MNIVVFQVLEKAWVEKSPDNFRITEKSSDPKEDLLVGEIRKAIGGVTVDEDRLPHRELEDAHRGVEHVVDHLGQLVSPIGYKRALRPSQQIEDTVPESKEPKCDSEVHSKPLWFVLKIKPRLGPTWKRPSLLNQSSLQLGSHRGRQNSQRERLRARRGWGWRRGTFHILTIVLIHHHHHRGCYASLTKSRWSPEEKELSGGQRNPPTWGRNGRLLRETDSQFIWYLLI